MVATKKIAPVVLILALCCIMVLRSGVTNSLNLPSVSQGSISVANGTVDQELSNEPRLVVLGGSIAAGFGLAPQSASNRCGRSKDGFGDFIAKDRHFRLVQAACSSARSAEAIYGQPHRQESQLRLVASDVRGSTVIVGPFGGNDVDWTREANVCLLHGCKALTASRNRATISAGVYDPNKNPAVYQIHLEQLGINLGIILRTLKHEHAKKIIVDEYYSVADSLNGLNCLYERRTVTGATHSFSQADLDFLTARLNALNTVIATQAHAVRATRVQPDFRGHGVCAAESWVAVHGFHDGAPMHPTFAGQAALARFNEAALEKG